MIRFFLLFLFLSATLSGNNAYYRTIAQKRSSSSILQQSGINYYLADSETGGSIANGGTGGAGSMAVTGAVALHYVPADGAYVYLVDDAANTIRSTVANVFSSGDFFVAVKVACDDYTTLGDEQVIISKNHSANPDRGYYWRFLSYDGMNAYGSGNGTAQLLNSSSAGISPTNGVIVNVAHMYDASNGSTVWESRFFTSSDNWATWDETGGSPDVGASAGSLNESSYDLTIGSRDAGGGGDEFKGKIYKERIWVGQLDDTGDPSWEFSAALTGQTGYTDSYSGVATTIYRGTSGYKATVVQASLLLAATDDYTEVSDHASLDVGTSTDFWAGAYIRYHGTPAASQVVLAKKADLTTGAGYVIYINTSGQPVGVVADGTNSVTITGTALTDHAATLIVLQRNGSNIELIQANSGGAISATPVTDTTSDLSNASAFRGFRLSDAGTSYADCEGMAWLQGDTVLTEADVILLLSEI